jgi:hypothetical protein
MIRTRTIVNIPVALVWQQKTANIVALIVKQSRPGRRSLADVGIRNVLAKLTEVEMQARILQCMSELEKSMSIETILIILLVVFLLGGGGWYFGRG